MSLKEALGAWSIDPAVSGDGLHHKQRMTIAAAARAYEEGETIQWCETHSLRVRPCPFDPAEPCRLVSRRVCPTIKEETE